MKDVPVVVAAQSGMPAARKATVCVWDRSKGGDGHRGQGLLIPIDGEGFVVLTCHHVIAAIREEDLCVKLPQSDGGLGGPLHARYDAERSHPDMDAAVLRLDVEGVTERPVLHRLGLDSYDGVLQATVLTHLSPDNFNAEVRASTRLEIDAAPSKTWPVPAGLYKLRAFRLADPGDARQGVSGGVVLCQGGVLGLVHFARGEGSVHAREDYLIPLDVWTKDWPALEELIEPLIDEALRGAAIVKRVSKLEIGTDLVVSGYREDVYLEREVEQQGRVALGQAGVVIVGRPKSGKTRLAVELLRQHPDALVMAPYAGALPPERLEVSGMQGSEIFVLFDDLHRAAGTTQPLRWQRRLQETTECSCKLICTTRDGRDWSLVKDKQMDLVELIGKDGVVYTSMTGEPGAEVGEDLTTEQGRELASKLDIDEQQFEARFDGTPGSLLLNLDDMRRRYEMLREEDFGGVPGSRLLDAAKLLHKGGQTRLPDRTLRAVAEQIRGDGSIGDDVWETLRRHSQEQGFGRFDGEEDFQIYRPYLEQCVPYEPSERDIDCLGPLFAEIADFTALLQLSFSWSHSFDGGAKRLEIIDTVVQLKPELPLAWFGKAITLSDLGRDEESLEAYEEALRREPDWPEVWVNKGMALNKLTLHTEALDAFEEALRLASDLPEGWLGKGVSLAALHRSTEAITAYEQAIELRFDYPSAWHNKATELQSLGRSEEAMQHYDIALVLKPDYGLAHHNKGNLLGDVGKYQEALEAYVRAIECGSDYPHEDWAGKGIALKNLSRYEEALEAFDRSLELEPNYAEAWHGKGVTLDESGRHEEALKAFERGIGLKPDSPILLHSKGIALVNLERFEEALGAFDEVLAAEQPESLDTLISKAGVLLKLKRNRAAVRVVERAISLNPYGPLSWDLKADILFEIGRYQEAKMARDHATFLRTQKLL